MLRKRKSKRPVLVIPSLVIRAHPEEEGWSLDDHFLFGKVDYNEKTVPLSLPLDPMVAAAISVRRPREGEDRHQVTYDPEEAHQRLLGIVHNRGTASKGTTT